MIVISVYHLSLLLGNDPPVDQIKKEVEDEDLPPPWFAYRTPEGNTSRRPAAGRAQLLAKRAHVERVQIFKHVSRRSPVLTADTFIDVFWTSLLKRANFAKIIISNHCSSKLRQNII